VLSPSQNGRVYKGEGKFHKERRSLFLERKPNSEGLIVRRGSGKILGGGKRENP